MTCWFKRVAPTCREVAVHARRIDKPDLSHPVILAASGRLMVVATELRSQVAKLATPRRSRPLRLTRSTDEDEPMSGEVQYAWRASLTDAEMVDLVESHGGRPEVGWWDHTRQHSLGWVTARTEEGFLVGFANVAWDGGDHAFLLDPKTRGTRQHEGIGTAVVALAVKHARAAGCEWLHVDFDPELVPFYLGACGFERTDAGLIHLVSQR